MPSYSPRAISTGTRSCAGSTSGSFVTMSRYVPVGHGVAVLRFRVGERVADGRIGGARLVAREDAAVQLARRGAHVVRAVELDVLRAVRERRRAAPVHVNAESPSRSTAAGSATANAAARIPPDDSPKKCALARPVSRRTTSIAARKSATPLAMSELPLVRSERP